MALDSKTSLRRRRPKKKKKKSHERPAKTVTRLLLCKLDQDKIQSHNAIRCAHKDFETIIIFYLCKLALDRIESLIAMDARYKRPYVLRTRYPLREADLKKKKKRPGFCTTHSARVQCGVRKTVGWH